MNAPLVSICTPTYKRPDWLSRTIRSVLGQTYKNFEMIITDNSPDDVSQKLVASFNDPRISYYKNQENLGALKNIIRAGSLAKGKYVILLMDDDLLYPPALELMVDAFEKHPNVGIVWAPMALIDANTQRNYPYFYLVRKMYYRYRYKVGDGVVDRKTLLREFLVRDYPCTVPSGMMYRMEAFQKVGGLDLQSDFAIDLDMAMRIAVEWDFYYIDQVLSAFRHTPVCYTASLHIKGCDVGIYYYIAKKLLADPKAMSLFSPEEQKKIRRQAYFFCSRRAILNIIPGIRGRRLSIITETLGKIWREDPYLLNKLLLPFSTFWDVLASFKGPEKPLPKEGPVPN